MRVETLLSLVFLVKSLSSLILFDSSFHDCLIIFVYGVFSICLTLADIDQEHHDIVYDHRKSQTNYYCINRYQINRLLLESS